MRTFPRCLLLLALLIGAGVNAVSQRPAKPPAGVIAGRVTVGGKAAPGTAVTLMPSEMRWQAKPVARTRTDEDGRYRLTNVAAGRYIVVVATPGLVAAQELRYRQGGKLVSLDAGETIEGIDFALVRGGVITGRVTNADDQPVIGELISLKQIDERGQQVSSFYFDPFKYATDDRGVYRIFGLTAGRYLVSAGHGGERSMVRLGFGSSYYARTFHPETVDESKATVVEVTVGGEATGIDIKLGRPSKTYTATGRIVDAQTGEPVVDVTYGYGPLQGDGKSLGAFSFSGARTNNRGEFRIEGLLPDRYAAFSGGLEDSEQYSDPVTFEVKDGDVSGLEIKVHRGASISGVVAVEGVTNPVVLAKLSQVELSIGAAQREELSAPRSFRTKVAANGAFRASGLREGKFRILISNYPSPPKGFSVLRVERDGVEQPGGILDVAAGAAISSVRVVLAYGTSVVRGQVRIEGGELPEGAVLYVTVNRTGNAMPQPVQSVQVDVNRRFLIDGLAAGDYELTLFAHFPPTSGTPNPVRLSPVKQNITVTGEGESQVTMALDLNRKNEQGMP